MGPPAPTVSEYWSLSTGMPASVVWTGLGCESVMLVPPLGMEGGLALRARSPVPAPLFLSGPTPDPSVAVVQCPAQTGPGDRAHLTYPLRFFDLGQGGSDGAKRKEQ